MKDYFQAVFSYFSICQNKNELAPRTRWLWNALTSWLVAEVLAGAVRLLISPPLPCPASELWPRLHEEGERLTLNHWASWSKSPRISFNYMISSLLALAVFDSILKKEQAIRKIATGSILFFWKTVLGLRSIATVIVAIADWFSKLHI